jgi:ferritin
MLTEKIYKQMNEQMMLEFERINYGGLDNT